MEFINQGDFVYLIFKSTLMMSEIPQSDAEKEGAWGENPIGLCRRRIEEYELSEGRTKMN